MSADRLALEWMAGRYAVCRLATGAPVPDWAAAEQGAALLAVTRTDRELSVIAPQEAVPDGVTAERGWRACRVVGTLEFTETGVMAALAGALADAGVSMLAVSTYDTDILLVREGDVEAAVRALSKVADVSRLGGGGG